MDAGWLGKGDREAAHCHRTNLQKGESPHQSQAEVLRPLGKLRESWMVKRRHSLALQASHHIRGA